MVYLLVLLFAIISSSITHPSPDQKFRENVPRFKSPHSPKKEVYLGDKIRLNCLASSNSPFLVEWFRNDKLVTEKVMDHGRMQKERDGMLFSINHITVSDQGMWSCRVTNSYGKITRNFTIEVIDFCDYFLIPDINAKSIPMECVCLWRYTKERKRTDIDYSAATEANCKKYESRMISRARNPISGTLCFKPPCNFTGVFAKSVFNSFDPNSVTRVTLTEDDLHDVEEEFDQTNSDEDDDDDDEEEDINYNQPISADVSLMELNYTEEAPYFKNPNATFIINETHGLPAGRTLKLNCRVYGNPEPRIVWYKDNERLTRRSSRNGGYSFKFKRFTLELEDSVESDAGTYRCEAYNFLGTATKFFHVIVVNRMRRPPIILPNVLKNLTVNVNDTATFNCKVMSDLVPHIMWVRINKVNGSYHYYNDTAGEHMFSYTEMDAMDNAHVHHSGEESTLTLRNVTLDDQGVYACISGNSLGMTIENATLTVNDFVSIRLLTGDDPSTKKLESTIMTFFAISLASVLLFIICFFSIFYRYKIKKKEMMDDTVGLVPKKKRVVVNKKPPDENDGADIPTYQIQIIEQAISPKEAGKRKRQQAENGDNADNVLPEYEVDSDPNWEIKRERLKLIHMLGEGAFGEVWKAQLAGEKGEEIPVAVKRLKMSAHEKELIDLVSEMETFKIIGKHENLLRLIGCCTGSGPLYVVLELCRHGNLRDFLRAHRPKEEKSSKKSSQDLEDYLEPRKISDKEEIDLIPNLTQRHLVGFAWQVAKGMDFMAKKKIIHRDLAARNVLVADNHILKISDFGLSRDVHCNDYYRKRGNGRLPIKWMALEALDSHMYTIESDVWSFGILLWEIMTLGGTPYPTIAMPELYSTLKEGYRMEAPHNCPDEVYNIMVACWQEKRENRPSFSTIVDYLDWMLVQSVDDGEIADRLESKSATVSPANSLMNFVKKRKHRPLSAPVNLPSLPQHDICDDDMDEAVSHNGDLYHFYCNDKNNPKHPSGENLSRGLLPGYVKPDNLIQIGGITNPSLDSAIGSPAWPSYERTSNNNLNSVNTTCLGKNAIYYNINNKVQYTYFDFNPRSIMTRSRDSAICEDSYYNRYPIYSNICIDERIWTEATTFDVIVKLTKDGEIIIDGMRTTNTIVVELNRVLLIMSPHADLVLVLIVTTTSISHVVVIMNAILRICQFTTLTLASLLRILDTQDQLIMVHHTFMTIAHVPMNYVTLTDVIITEYHIDIIMIMKMSFQPIDWILPNFLKTIVVVVIVTKTDIDQGIITDAHKIFITVRHAIMITVHTVRTKMIKIQPILGIIMMTWIQEFLMLTIRCAVLNLASRLKNIDIIGLMTKEDTNIQNPIRKPTADEDQELCTTGNRNMHQLVHIVHIFAVVDVDVVFIVVRIRKKNRAAGDFKRSTQEIIFIMNQIILFVDVENTDKRDEAVRPFASIAEAVPISME
ncbi:unnamed protein product [Caenorhabditis bovis]|uniref:receptor protein-tyrosine kinase n=1 Tax=Caenorhabditis bovis TaxID=2654633 RepID=A0A8S1EHZ7_9PELO|nr:unnamed protein product [Caenorhabditis bovis]